jgi:hypothetical protein
MARALRRAAGVALALLLIEGLLRLGFVGLMPYLHRDCSWQAQDLNRLLVAYEHRLGRGSQILGTRWMHDPRRGYKLAPGLQDHVDGASHASSRVAGVRGDREVALPKPAGRTRVLALGDSFTFGDDVEDSETWPQQVDELLGPAVEVLNLGASAYGHDQMLLALLDDGLALDPDLVVLGYIDIDRFRNPCTHFCAEKPRYVPDGAGIRLDNVPVPDLEELARRYHDSPLVWQALRVLWGRLTDTGPWPGDEVTARIFAAMQEACEARGVRFAMVYLAEHGVHRSSRPDREFEALCAKGSISCGSTLSAFARLLEEEGTEPFRRRYFLDDKHYSAAGNRVAAEVVAAFLRAKAWVPPLSPGGRSGSRRR